MAKRKRRRRISGLPAIIILFILLVAGAVTWAFFYFNGNKMNLPGEWYREIDLTEVARENAKQYIETAEFGNDIDIDMYFENLVVESKLEVTKEGRFVEKVDEAQYYSIEELAREGLKKAVCDLISMRIKNNYIETNMTPEELVKETFGMDLSEYLRKYGPELIPSYSTINEQYGSDTVYTADRDSIVLGEEGTAKNSYAVTHGMIVIDYKEGAVVYHERK